MKSAWDFVLLRRTTNQIGIVTFAAGLVHGFIGEGGILSTLTLIAVGIVLIVFSILRRYQMNEVVIAALVGALPLIILMIIGLYLNRDVGVDSDGGDGGSVHSLPKNTP